MRYAERTQRMPTLRMSRNYALPLTAIWLILSGCATSSPPPKLPDGQQVVTVPCPKPPSPPSAAVQAASVPVDFLPEVSSYLNDVRGWLKTSTPASSKP